MNIANEVERRWSGRPDEEALILRADTGDYRGYSYGRLFLRVAEYADLLRGAGAVPGDRVALVGENSPEWIVAFLSVSKLECVAVLIDPSLGDAAVADLIQKSDPILVMASPRNAGRIAAGLPVFDLSRGTFYSAGGAAVPERAARSADDDGELAAILYSSGTASTAKGVMHRHGALAAMAEKTISHNRIAASDRFLAVIPLYHIYGLMSGLVCPLLAGSRVCFLESATSENLLSAFREFRPTGFGGVPAIFNLFKSRIEDTAKSGGALRYLLFRGLLAACAALRRATGINFGKAAFARVHRIFGGAIRGFLSGGAYLDPAVVRFFYGLGFYLLNNYGLTETGIPVASNSLSYFTLDTCGEMFDGVSVSIRGADDGAGEILVKSVGMMAGYFRDQEATRAAFDEEGRFRTGDLGYLDRRGDLVITGRAKDTIVLPTGKKLAPDDVEEAYRGVSGVAELVVSGVPAEDGSADEIHCFVVKDAEETRTDGEISADIQRVGAGLPDYMRVAGIHFLDAVPRTALRKPKRYLLRRIAAEERKDEAAETAGGSREGGPARELVVGIAGRLYSGGRAIRGSTRLVEDLGFDSLTVTEFLALLRSETGADLFRILTPNLTVDDVARAIAAPRAAPAAEAPRLDPFPLSRRWMDEAVFRFLAAYSGLAYRIVVEGAERLPGSGGYLLCPNHQSHLDGLWVLMQLPEGHRGRFCSMAKREHLDTPFGRLLLRIGRGIPVDRYGNPVPAYERCLEKLKEGWIVLLHPEGTRTSDGSIGPFKGGAAKLSIESGLPIVPVRVSGAFEVYPRNRPLPRIFDFRRVRRYGLRISFGSPLMPAGRGVEELTRELSEAVARL